MTAGKEPEVSIPEATLQRLRGILDAHDVELGIVFGSAAQPDDYPADIDLAVSFSDRRPSEDGYASAYFDLLTDLEDELGCEIDLVDVHSMQPRFGSVVFDEGVLVFGSSDRRDALAEHVGDVNLSLEDARDRIEAAATRLREQSP